MGHTFTEERREQRITAFTRFVQEQGWALISLGMGDYHTHHYLVKQNDHLVEVTFGPQGGIYVSVESGSNLEHLIRPRLLPWIKREQPRYEGRHGGRPFSDLARPYLPSPSSPEVRQRGPSENTFPGSEHEKEEADVEAEQQWIADQFEVYRSEGDFPPCSSATEPRWVTRPTPTVHNGRAGTVVTMEFAFDASEPRLRAQFALRVQHWVAQEDCAVLHTVTFPVNASGFHQGDPKGKETSRYLTVVHLLIFDPHAAQQKGT